MWKNDLRNIAESARGAINTTDPKSKWPSLQAERSTSQEFTADPIYHDDIEALRKDPRSSKAHEARAKLARVTVSDDEIWNEVRSTLRRGKVTTNVCVAMTFSDSIIEDVVIKILERNNKIETRPEAPRASMLKFVRNPFLAGGTGLRALNDEEVLSSLRGVLKKPAQSAAGIVRSGRRVSDPFAERRTGRSLLGRGLCRDTKSQTNLPAGLDPCGRRDSKRGSFTMSISAGRYRSQSCTGATKQVDENSNLYDVCRSITLEQEEPELEPTFRSLMSTAMKRCSFNENGLGAVASADGFDELTCVGRRQSLRSSWTSAARRASCGFSSLAATSPDSFASERPGIAEVDEETLLEDFPTRAEGMENFKTDDAPQSSLFDSFADVEQRHSCDSSFSAGSSGVVAPAGEPTRGPKRPDWRLARAA
jgi:hypothetical protein